MYSLKKYIKEELLFEGLKYFKYSDKLKKLISKLEKKVFHLPGEKKKVQKTNLEEIIETLKNDILIDVKNIEKKFKNKTITKKYANEKIKAIRPKVKEVIKYLKGKNILSSFDWKWLISSALFVPMAAGGIDSLLK